MTDMYEDVAEQRDAARAELDRLHSWDGLLDLLDEHWPAKTFTGESGDPGPRIVSLIRAVERERSSRQAWAEEAAALKQAARDSYDELGDYIRTLTELYRPMVAGRRVAATKAQAIIGGYFGAVMSDWHNAEDKRVCACVSDGQASKLGAGFTRPQCTVHPDGGAA